MDEALRIAVNCRHYAMCKIDFLGTGVCPSGLAHHYVSFYPEGRMDLYAALAKHRVPVTEECVSSRAVISAAGAISNAVSSQACALPGLWKR